MWIFILFWNCLIALKLCRLNFKNRRFFSSWIFQLWHFFCTEPLVISFPVNLIKDCYFFWGFTIHSFCLYSHSYKHSNVKLFSIFSPDTLTLWILYGEFSQVLCQNINYQIHTKQAGHSLLHEKIVQKLCPRSFAEKHSETTSSVSIVRIKEQTCFHLIGQEFSFLLSEYVKKHYCYHWWVLISLSFPSIYKMNMTILFQRDEVSC